MKMLLAMLVALLLHVGTYGQTTRAITLDNTRPCAYVTRVQLLDIAANGSVDVIKYRLGNADFAPAYVYKGPALWQLWKDGGKDAMPEGTTLADSTKAPAATEIGTVDLKNGSLVFVPVRSDRVSSVFKNADDVMKGYSDDASVLSSSLKQYESWIESRFVEDIGPNPWITCVSTCECRKVAPNLTP